MNTNENTIRVVLSIEEVIRSMYAESVWNEATSETSVPPIHHLSKSSDYEEMRRRAQESYQRMIEVFSGYIEESSDKEGKEEQWQIEMKNHKGITLATARKMEEAIETGALKEIYKPQMQAEELAKYYEQRYGEAISAIKQSLAK